MNAAIKRNAALDKLAEFRVVILEHILKVSLLPKHEACTHWQIEIDSYAKRLCKYHKGKGSRSNYTRDILFEYIWDDQCDELPLGFLETYGVHEVILNLGDVKKRVHIFIDSVL